MKKLIVRITRLLASIAMFVSLLSAAWLRAEPATSSPIADDGITIRVFDARSASPSTRPAVGGVLEYTTHLDHASGAATQPATRPAVNSPFMRFVEDTNGGGKLETAIVTYQNAAGVTLHVVGAVHVGEQSYYESLNKTFADYDVLLYEMIKPKGMHAPVRGQRSHSAIGGFQRMLKSALSLDYQLDDIDYTQPNFVHADLDAETFASMQDARGESIFGIMLRSMFREMGRQAEGTEHKEFDMIDLLVAMRAPDRPRQLKLLLAKQFDDIEDQMSGLDGPNGSVIITERNKKCLEVLGKQIADGRKNIGIFYGAGHMHDMSQRIEVMGFHKTATEWRICWDMTAPPATEPAISPK